MGLNAMVLWEKNGSECLPLWRTSSVGGFFQEIVRFIKGEIPVCFPSEKSPDEKSEIAVQMRMLCQRDSDFLGTIRALAGAQTKFPKLVIYCK